jgi:cob(I)alamin adenosyltransferase
MSIVTKTGDGGTTGLWSGERIDKDDMRVECYGTIDELSSVLGMARHACSSTMVLAEILAVQKDLYRVAGELASPSALPAFPMRAEDEERLSSRIGDIEGELGLRGVVIPGMTPGSAALDLARTVARRAERRIVALSRRDAVSPELRKYVNRISDFLFILARREEWEQGAIRYVKA